MVLSVLSTAKKCCAFVTTATTACAVISHVNKKKMPKEVDVDQQELQQDSAAVVDATSTEAESQAEASGPTTTPTTAPVVIPSAVDRVEDLLHAAIPTKAGG